MTVIRPNSVSGINSITAQADEIKVFKSDGTQGGLIIGGANLNATSGISTILALNVTGNVSIAGTLTYQDVTNVDSVGIITARSTIDAQGDVSIADKIIHTGDTNTAIRFPAGDVISAETNGAERLRIDSGGGVQVGTSTPTASKVTVYGANDAAAIFQGSSTGTGAANGFLVGNNGGTDGLLWNYENGNTKIATNNVERLRITSDGHSYFSGNLGIGTAVTTPATTLHLDSTGTPTTIQIDSDTESSIDFNDHGGSAKRYKIGTNISDNSGQFEIKDISANAQRLRITSAGNIGINQSSPAVLFHASKSYSAPTGGFDSNIVAALTNSGSDSYAGLAIQGGSGAGSFIHFGDTDDSNIGIINYEHSDNSMRFTVNASERFRIQSDGEVRIDGANDSQVLIHTDGGGWLNNSGNVVEVTGYFNYSGSRIGMYVNNSGEGVLGTKTTYGLNFYTNNTRRMRINGSGSVIFGNSTEGVTEPFFVETGGTIRRRYQSTNGSGIHFTGGSLMPTTGTGAFTNGGTNIGTGSYRWGQIYSTSSSISTSDRTLKNTIQSSDLGLEFIKKLHPVSYKFNDGTSGRTHYGLISQDVETVLTSLDKTGVDFGGFCKDKNTRVETKPDENGEMIDVQIEEEGDTYSLRYEEFIGPLVKAVQELSTEVETLKTKVATLEGS